jgi:putative ABC transport system permease protein
MALPLSYHLRSLTTRWQVTLLSIGGIALAVAVLVSLLAMASGFAIALRATGRTDNAIILEGGAVSEVMSGIPVDALGPIVDDAATLKEGGGPMQVSPEILSLISLPRVGDRTEANVGVRGVTSAAFDVRGGIKLVEGRRFAVGPAELIVGVKARERFDLGVGSRIEIRRRPWAVVGVFASDGSGMESEIWGDLHTLAGPLRRTGMFQAIVLRAGDQASVDRLAVALTSDRRLRVQAKQERQFYEEQAGGVVRALTGLALFVALIMGLGAAFAAMNTMNGIVASRTREVATLRALGFSRGAVLLCFVTESALLALIGGALGCLLAIPANGWTGATSGANYSELAFAFRTTPLALGAGLVFALVVGILGGLLPALRAARLPIAAALREA